MVKEYLLSDIINNKDSEDLVKLDIPLPVKNILSDIYISSLNFPNTVVDLKIVTYDYEENQYKLYFGWATDKIIRSTNVAYIAYDKQKHDFFDWLTISFREERYTNDQLLSYFNDKFSE
jgi:hypothetical protein